MAAFARSVTASALYVTPMCAHVLWSKFVTSATSEASKGDARSAVDQESVMPTIARSVLKWRKIGMGAPRLSTWVAPRLISGMNARNTDSRRDEHKGEKTQIG